MEKHDVVYFLKDNIATCELKYSLRSVAKNFYHGDIWFVGGQPGKIVPDHRLPIKQNAATKWENVRNMLKKVCENDDISEEFWLVNDDFFIIKPWTSEAPLYNGTLERHIQHVEMRHGNQQTAYTAKLRECQHALESAGYDTLNYAIHCPMLVNRKKMSETLRCFPDVPMFRSLYGNMNAIGGEDHCDCKIAGLDRLIDSEWVSTTDESFSVGRIGRYIREQFREPSPWENREGVGADGCHRE